jgi:hypothetical protein
LRRGPALVLGVFLVFGGGGLKFGLFVGGGGGGGDGRRD